MSLFQCNKCGCVENTATSMYNCREPGQPPLCSECDPEIGKWHNCFPKESAKGWILCNDGFLYSKEQIDTDGFKWRVKHQGLQVVKEIEGPPSNHLDTIH